MPCFRAVLEVQPSDALAGQLQSLLQEKLDLAAESSGGESGDENGVMENGHGDDSSGSGSGSGSGSASEKNTSDDRGSDGAASDD